MTNVVSFISGFIFGYLFPKIDIALQAIVLETKGDVVLEEIAQLWKKHRFLLAFQKILQAKMHGKLIHRRMLFLLALPIVGFFLITSTGSLVGQGLYIGLSLNIIFHMLPLLRYPSVLRGSFFWDPSADVPFQTIQKMIAYMLIAFGGTVLLMVI